MSDDPDDAFLRYVSIHAETPRALFSKEHTIRLLRLAGEDTIAADVEHGDRRFYALHSDQADPLIATARSRIKAAEARAEAKVERGRMMFRQFQTAADRALGET